MEYWSATRRALTRQDMDRRTLRVSSGTMTLAGDPVGLGFCSVQGSVAPHECLFWSGSVKVG